MSLITNWRRILAKIVCNSAECVPCGPWESKIICQSTESSTKHNMYCFIIWTAEQSVKRTGPWYSDIDDPQRIQTLYSVPLRWICSLQADLPAKWYTLSRTDHRYSIRLSWNTWIIETVLYPWKRLLHFVRLYSMYL